MKESLEKVIAGRHLSRPEMERCFDMIMSGRGNDVQIGGFLTALRIKGETPDEIETAARVMRRHAVPVNTGCGTVVDTCGTGGDGASTFNISTAVAFVMAGAGYKVAKHGNRSVSSSSGSADCLEALGVPINLKPADAASAVRDKGFCFLFAPAYHPSMKYAMPARKQLGIRTVFNTLGPLANPAGATHQVIGVYCRSLVDPICEALKNMGLKGAMVVHGGLDEVSVSGPTRYARLSGGTISRGDLRPEDAGLSPLPADDLRVTSPRESARKIVDLFEESLGGACLNSLLLNAAAAFMAVDGTVDLKDGVAMARDVLRSGRALEALNRARA
ncbi:MAG TPA: anthranilate phosphoribosyltransferase [Deltaproteobacteria bacterium]|jgi:anthranilate phosphoribosyltransferase|nr:anthranilate phosphoribosyltransferase [Deltaproteobacteria bacterium]OQC22964.1 MAG: Anthranilate phosphoribosyltransferase [Deltaproteobacteria bacterium ADurb.Bin072]HRW81124.1 anthranilate phosphoribosyltransferase [Desulfomonilia bacterium]NMD40972.1 anthranilate phosphoribosyltransferase [Deltaproteobacteria bacterium]HNS90470.1 anthranilate phosphoribosyltransferase [Deltaproteobacteria bacterium]